MDGAFLSSFFLIDQALSARYQVPPVEWHSAIIFSGEKSHDHPTDVKFELRRAT
jgi:hypothetical protein